MSPGLVQVASSAAIAASVTVTLGAGTTGGNCLVAPIGDAADTTSGSVSGVTLGGSADNWAQVIATSAGGHALAAGWADPGCANNQTAVAVSLTGGVGDRLFATVFEFSGLTGTLDASSVGNNGFAGTWTSGTSGITVQASEVAFGVTCGASNGTPGLAGPASPWVNEAQQTLTGATHTKNFLCGYQILSSTGTVTYAGTASPTNTNDTAVFTLEASGSSNVTASFSLAMAPPAMSFTAAETISARFGLATAPLKLSFTAAEQGANINAHFSLAMAPLRMLFSQPGAGGQRAAPDDYSAFKRFRKRRYR